MPDLTITVTAQQATRILNAFGHYRLNADLTQTWVPATSAEMQAMIKAWAKQQVQMYEAQQAATSVTTNVQAEVW